MVQLEELESRFSEHDGFIADLGKKREEIYEAFARQEAGAARSEAEEDRQPRRGRQTYPRRRAARARAFKSEDELNAYFARTRWCSSWRQLGEQLLELGDSVKSDELGGRLKAARQEGLRGLRDKLELFEEGADIIKLGRHRFSVNTQSFDLTVVPRDGGLALHLTSTDFYEPIDDPIVNGSKAYWDQTLVSETAGVYRAEFLAASILLDAEAAGGVAALEALHAAERGPGAGGLLELVRKAAADRYSEGYERGLHDHDAAKILSALLDMRTTAGLLRYGPDARAIAALWWAHHSEDPEEFKPRVLSSFVRNQLIDPRFTSRLIGDNLAKQIGAAGDGEAHGPDGVVAAHLAARLRQDDADGIRREPAGHGLHEDQRPGAGARASPRSIPPRRRMPPRARRSSS
jgi:hypothetical protein